MRRPELPLIYFWANMLVSGLRHFLFRKFVLIQDKKKEKKKKKMQNFFEFRQILFSESSLWSTVFSVFGVQ